VFFVSSTFSTEVKKQPIFSKQNNSDQFLYLTHEQNWSSLTKKIKKETGAKIKKKDDKIKAKG
jgi:hypothetical protein